MSLKGTLLFFVGIVVEYEEREKKKASQSPKSNKSANKGDSENNENSPSVLASPRSDNVKLTPLMIAAQQNDLKGCCAELAEIAVQIEEAAHLESPEAAGDSPPQRDGNETGSPRKRASKKANKDANQDSESQKYSAANLLKKQANELVESANEKWSMALQQAETFFWLTKNCSFNAHSNQPQKPQ